MKLTNRQILSLSEAINALDGQQVTQIVEGKPVAVARIPRPLPAHYICASFR